MIFPYYFDWTIILIIPGIIVAAWAQSRVSRAYRIYSKMHIMSGVSGSETARRILLRAGISGVEIRAATGLLTDNYNPRKRTLNLSEQNYSDSSIAAVAVAAHESGHAMQHAQGYIPLHMRNVAAPVISVASYMLWPILMLGIFAGFAEQTINIAVYIFLGIFVFQVITLPVEYNASRRALSALVEEGILSGEETDGARKMLNAAALTYVAATLVALRNVVRFMMISNRRQR